MGGQSLGSDVPGLRAGPVNGLRMKFGGVPVRKTSCVPLLDGDGSPVLCWKLLGEILVHPERWDEFVARLEG